jgi:phage-related protein
MGQHGLPKGQKWDEDRNHIGNIVGIVGIVAIIYIYITGTLRDFVGSIMGYINNHQQ